MKKILKIASILMVALLFSAASKGCDCNPHKVPSMSIAPLPGVLGSNTYVDTYSAKSKFALASIIQSASNYTEEFMQCGSNVERNNLITGDLSSTIGTDEVRRKLSVKVQLDTRSTECNFLGDTKDSTYLTFQKVGNMNVHQNNQIHNQIWLGYTESGNNVKMKILYAAYADDDTKPLEAIYVQKTATQKAVINVRSGLKGTFTELKKVVEFYDAKGVITSQVFKYYLAENFENHQYTYVAEGRLLANKSLYIFTNGSKVPSYTLESDATTGKRYDELGIILNSKTTKSKTPVAATAADLASIEADLKKGFNNLSYTDEDLMKFEEKVADKKLW